MIVGSIVALITPMLPGSGEIDWDNLKRLVDWHIEMGTSAIVAAGTTGESATLSIDENVAVIDAIVRQAGGRVPVIAGTGSNATSEALELTRRAKESGADACLLVCPYYNTPSQEGLYQHHKVIAESVDIDQVLYNVPGRTACDMLPDTVRRLAEIPNIVGIKEATGDMERARELIDTCPADFAIYSGDDSTATELMLMGGKGDISVTANVAPRQVAEMCAAALAGEAKRARELNEALEPLHRALFVESNPIPVKWAVAELGLSSTSIRLPLTELSVGFHANVRAALQGLGIV